MITLNIILFAFNLVLVPVALMCGWLKGYDEANEVNWELYDSRDRLEKAYADFGRKVYENLIKEDDHEQG